MHSRIKHISIQCHFLRENVVEQEFKLEFEPTKDFIVNIFTKALSKDTFEYLQQNLGVISPPCSNYMYRWCIYPREKLMSYPFLLD